LIKKDDSPPKVAEEESKVTEEPQVVTNEEVTPDKVLQEPTDEFKPVKYGSKEKIKEDPPIDEPFTFEDIMSNISIKK